MNVALILSGGTGTRLGADNPKQYIEVGGKPIICYCAERLLRHDKIDAVQIVADQSWHDAIRNWILEKDINKKFKGFSLPGENRQLSIFHGLEDIRKYASDEDFVLIHDAARPLLSEGMISEYRHLILCLFHLKESVLHSPSIFLQYYLHTCGFPAKYLHTVYFYQTTTLYPEQNHQFPLVQMSIFCPHCRLRPNTP